jgi:hypothetical protein
MARPIRQICLSLYAALARLFGRGGADPGWRRSTRPADDLDGR